MLSSLAPGQSSAAAGQFLGFGDLLHSRRCGSVLGDQFSFEREDGLFRDTWVQSMVT